MTRGEYKATLARLRDILEDLNTILTFLEEDRRKGTATDWKHCRLP